jgi:hypothetical protein
VQDDVARVGRWSARRSDVIAVGFWVAAVALFAAAAVVGPEAECVRANYDEQVSSSRVAGLLLFACTLAMGGAAAFLAAGAIRGRGPANIVRALTALVSLGTACLMGFFALLEFVALQCLE